MPSPYSWNHPIARSFTEMVRNTQGVVSANYSNIEGYIAARTMADGLRRACPKGNRDSLIAGLEGMGTQVLGGFAINFSKTERVASKFVALSKLAGDGRVRT